jgi:hypothetical protein
MFYMSLKYIHYIFPTTCFKHIGPSSGNKLFSRNLSHCTHCKSYSSVRRCLLIWCYVVPPLPVFLYCDCSLHHWVYHLLVACVLSWFCVPCTPCTHPTSRHYRKEILCNTFIHENPKICCITSVKHYIFFIDLNLKKTTHSKAPRCHSFHVELELKLGDLGNGTRVFSTHTNDNSRPLKCTRFLKL